MIDQDWTVVHGSPRPPIWEYVYNARIAALNFPLFDTSVCFVGHTHVQLYIREEEAMANVTPRHTVDRESIDLSEGRFIINPGSVGQPRDGDNRAAFAIYEPKRNRLTFRRVALRAGTTPMITAPSVLRMMKTMISTTTTTGTRSSSIPTRP